MSKSFDPYHKWLGIPSEEQPPNHYRLLGLVLFESDPDVIANAADARMAHLKHFQSGEYSSVSQRLLNEVATARVDLLNPQRRNVYDRQLRRRLGQASGSLRANTGSRAFADTKNESVPKANPPCPASTPPISFASPCEGDLAAIAAQPIAISRSASPLARQYKAKKRKRPTPLPAIWIGVSVMLVLAAFLATRQNDPATSSIEPKVRVASRSDWRSSESRSAPSYGSKAPGRVEKPHRNGGEKPKTAKLKTLRQNPPGGDSPEWQSDQYNDDLEEDLETSGDEPRGDVFDSSSEPQDMIPGVGSQSRLNLNNRSTNRAADGEISAAAPGSFANVVELPSGALLSPAMVDVSLSYVKELFPEDGPIWRVTLPNGSVRGWFSFYQGELRGPSASFHLNGTICTLANYDKMARLHGPLRVRDECGLPLLYAEFDKGTKHGVLGFFRDGNPWLIQEWKRNHRDSNYLTKFDNEEKFVVLESIQSEIDRNSLARAERELAELEKKIEESEGILKKDLKKRYREEDLRRRKERAAIVNPAQREAAVQQARARREENARRHEAMWKNALQRSGL